MGPCVTGRMLHTAVFVLVVSTIYSAHVEAHRMIQRASVGTFNTLLARGMPAFQERREMLLEILQRPSQNEVPDVLCLQEIPRRTEAEDIVEAMRNTHPYHASFDTLNDPPSLQPACTQAEAAAAFNCIFSQCAQWLAPNVSDSARFANCTAVECRDVLFSISTSCFFCTGNEFGAAEDVQANAFQRCASVIPASEYANPFSLLLVSRYPLSDVETVDLLDGERDVLLRGYIRARVEALSKTVFCTHLTTLSGRIDYVGPPQFSSSLNQQTFQVRVLLEAVENRSDVILFGDFNHGPAFPMQTDWIGPLNYGLMNARGLFSANAVWCGQCTFCLENILTASFGRDTDFIIDHVYLPTSMVSDVIRVQRLFDSVRTPSGLPLSDHYGASVLLRIHRRGNRRVCRGSDVLGRDVPFLDLDDIESQIDQFCPQQ